MLARQERKNPDCQTAAQGGGEPHPEDRFAGDLHHQGVQIRSEERIGGRAIAEQRHGRGDVLAVNQKSRNNRPHFELDGTRIWSAEADDGSTDRYLALFNTGAKPKEIPFRLDRIGLKGAKTVRDLWSGAELGPAGALFTAAIPPHGAGLYRLTPT